MRPIWPIWPTLPHATIGGSIDRRIGTGRPERSTFRVGASIEVGSPSKAFEHELAARNSREIMDLSAKILPPSTGRARLSPEADSPSRVHFSRGNRCWRSHGDNGQ